MRWMRRSCARYSAVRQPLGEPDPFRLQYREQITQLVTEVVRNNMNKPEAVAYIQGFTSQLNRLAFRGASSKPGAIQIDLLKLVW